MIMKKITGLLLISMALFSCLQAAGNSNITALTGGKIVLVSGSVIEKGTLIIENDIIKDIGTEIAIPDEAEIIDVTGLSLYPGMIDSYNRLGLSEIGAVSATTDIYEKGEYNPFIKTAIAINPHSVHIPITRVNGITTVMSAAAGGVISGQSVIYHLQGWTIDEMLEQKNGGLIITFPRQPEKKGGNTEQKSSASGNLVDKKIKELKDLLKKAERYGEAKKAFEQGKREHKPVLDLTLEALLPAVTKQKNTYIVVDKKADILNAVQFIRNVSLKPVFVGCSQGWRAADSLAAYNIPVILAPVLRSPDDTDPYDGIYANAGILHKAGVKIAFSTFSSSDCRNLPYQAGTAAAFGLDRTEALKAVTLNSAEILGIDDRFGSLEKGKVANIIVTTGDPLEMKTRIKHVFIRGKKISLKTKHTELYEQFKKRYEEH